MKDAVLEANVASYVLEPRWELVILSSSNFSGNSRFTQCCDTYAVTYNQVHLEIVVDFNLDGLDVTRLKSIAFACVVHALLMPNKP